MVQCLIILNPIRIKALRMNILMFIFYLPDGTVSQYKVVVGHIISETSVLYNTHIVDTASFVQEMVKTSSIKVDLINLKYNR